MVCVPLPTFFAVFRRWRTKLMRRENGTKLKNLTFDLNLLLAPTRAHQVFICNCFLVVSLFMLACFFHGCLMAQRVLSNLKQQEGTSRCRFKRVYYDAPMVTRPFSSVIGMSYIGGFKNRFLFLGSTLAQKMLVASN